MTCFLLVLYSQLGEIIFKRCFQFCQKWNCYKYLYKHVKINLMIVFWFSKIEISWKIAKKVDFRIFLDPFWHFILKKVLGIREFHNSWLPFGTKNHETRGPPVFICPQHDRVRATYFKKCIKHSLKEFLNHYFLV